jgi:hypothetical protein
LRCLDTRSSIVLYAPLAHTLLRLINIYTAGPTT